MPSATPSHNQTIMVSQDPPPDTLQLAICGGGIVGLILAIGLKERLGLTADVFEACDRFADDVGAGMGMYPNGLRVLRDISPQLFREVQEAGYPYKYRRWERHDGTEVAVAEENVLSDRDDSMQTIGIRRWRLQRVLYDAARRADIPIHFAKRTKSVSSLPDGTVEIIFEDGSKRTAHVVFGADGSKSAVRNSVADCGAKLQYTGTTCLMGVGSDTKSQSRGISLPSSSTSHCHGAFFPTREQEFCFQFHFPVAAQDADEGNWGTLSQEVGREECRKLAERLKKEGWHEKYLEPLANVDVAVRIGFCLLDKQLKKFVYGHRGRIVLLGDAAHPPVPFLGQGAQMGIEDAGVIITLLDKLCFEDDGNGGSFNLANFGNAMAIYEKMRLPRTAEILERSKLWGKSQQKRATCEKYNAVKEELIQRDVFFHETMDHLRPGAGYDFKEDIEAVLEKEPVLLALIEEES